jgi:hypothetical protein
MQKPGLHILRVIFVSVRIKKAGKFVSDDFLDSIADVRVRAGANLDERQNL